MEAWIIIGNYMKPRDRIKCSRLSRNFYDIFSPYSKHHHSKSLIWKKQAEEKIKDHWIIHFKCTKSSPCTQIRWDKWIFERYYVSSYNKHYRLRSKFPVSQKQVRKTAQILETNDCISELIVYKRIKLY